MGYCFVEVIRVLCGYGADMGVVTKAEDTPLHYAARNGDADCCRFLAQRGKGPYVIHAVPLNTYIKVSDFGHGPAAVTSLD